MTTILRKVGDAVAADGFSFVEAVPMQALLDAAGLRDWEGFRFR